MVLRNLTVKLRFIFIDVLVFADKIEEHAHRLDKVLQRFEKANLLLQRFEKANLLLQPEKCPVALPQINYLGYVVYLTR
jgi:hypothetical protein